MTHKRQQQQRPEGVTHLLEALWDLVAPSLKNRDNCLLTQQIHHIIRKVLLGWMPYDEQALTYILVLVSRQIGVTCAILTTRSLCLMDQLDLLIKQSSQDKVIKRWR